MSTPMDTQIRLTSEQAPKSAAEFAAMRDVPYREAVGALNWAALATRPDIAFAVATVARFAANPGPVHWDAVRCIFHYLAGMKEALWLRAFLSETFADFKVPTTLSSDNQAAIDLARDHQYHARINHIDVRYHWIRWMIEQGSLRLVYCPTDDMVADALTKSLPSVKVKHFAAGLRLRAK